MCFPLIVARKANISPEKYASIDVNLSRLELILDYATHCDPKLQSTNPRHLKEFLSHFSSQTAFGVQAAHGFLRQIKEDVFVESIAKKIRDETTPPTIVANPPCPMEDRLVNYRVCLADSKLDSSSAKKDVLCDWDFDHLGLLNARCWP